MARTMSIRMDDENYKFLRRFSKDEKGDMSSAVRELLNKGRVAMAVERYREDKVSLGKAAELAGVRVGELMDILARLGVEAGLTKGDVF